MFGASLNSFTSLFLQLSKKFFGDREQSNFSSLMEIKNTRFFCKYVSLRRVYNKIKILYDDEGE